MQFMKISITLCAFLFAFQFAFAQDDLVIGSVKYVDVSLPIEKVTSFTYSLNVPANTTVFITVTDADLTCPHIWSIAASNPDNASQSWSNEGSGADPGNAYPVFQLISRANILRTLPIPAMATNAKVIVGITPQIYKCTTDPKDPNPNGVRGFYIDVETASKTPMHGRKAFNLQFGQRLFFALPSVFPYIIYKLRLDSCVETSPHNANYTLSPRWGYGNFSPKLHNYSSTLADYYRDTVLLPSQDIAVIGEGAKPFRITTSTESIDFYFYIELCGSGEYPQNPPFPHTILANQNESYSVWFASVPHANVEWESVVHNEDLIIFSKGYPDYASRPMIPSDYQIMASCSSEGYNYAQNASFPMLDLFGSYCYFQNSQKNSTTKNLFALPAEVVPQFNISRTLFSVTLPRFLTSCKMPSNNVFMPYISIFDTKDKVIFGKVVKVTPSIFAISTSGAPQIPYVWNTTPAILFYVAVGALVIAIIANIVQYARRGRKSQEYSEL